MAISDTGEQQTSHAWCLPAGSADGSVSVWSVGGGWECMKTMRGHRKEVNSISVHPSGALALTCSRCAWGLEGPPGASGCTSDVHSSTAETETALQERSCQHECCARMAARLLCVLCACYACQHVQQARRQQECWRILCLGSPGTCGAHCSLAAAQIQLRDGVAVGSWPFHHYHIAPASRQSLSLPVTRPLPRVHNTSNKPLPLALPPASGLHTTCPARPLALLLNG